MDSRNCSLPAPETYSNLMHYSHIVSFPVYFVTLVILFREKSPIFRTYKYFIIVHIFINMISETYVTFFMLPMTYLPYPLFRTTGWLAKMGFSGLIQFYGLSHSVTSTIGSILEMFYYRLRVTVVLQETNRFITFCKYQLWVHWILVLIRLTLEMATLNRGIRIMSETTIALLQENPDLPKELTCHSVVIALPNDIYFQIVISTYAILIAISFSGAIGPMVYIIKFITKTKLMSVETIKLQKILIVSLFIQCGIHSIFIIVPTFVQVYAMFFAEDIPMNEFAQMLLLSVAYHGFLSTCAMIAFTKPIRDKVFFCCSRRNQTSAEASNVLSSNSVPPAPS